MVYEEKVVFTVGRVLFLVFPITSLFLFFTAYQQSMNGPIGNDPSPTWFYVAMGIFFLAMTYLMAQFSYLAIRIEEKTVLLSYGIFKVTIDRASLENVYLDRANPLFSYGGWGFRLGSFQGRPRKVLNIPGYQCVVLSRQGVKQEIVFSTAHPETIIQLLRPQSSQT